MNTLPLVSILINNYNYGIYLPHAIESALGQGYPRVEVIVVDDGSTDNSIDVIDRYGDAILPILKSNDGQASAFNAGFAASKGDIVCLLDADDVFVPEKADSVAETFEKYPHSAWLFHPLQMIDLITGESLGTIPLGPTGEIDIRAQMKRGQTIPITAPATSGLVFRRELLEKILPMPEAANVVLSDLYLKAVAMGLAAGYLSDRILGLQGVHERNAYTRRNDSLRRGRIAINTAYWIRKQYPQLVPYADKLFARGLSLIMQDSTAGVDETDKATIRRFFSEAPTSSALLIWLRYLKHRFGNVANTSVGKKGS